MFSLHFAHPIVFYIFIPLWVGISVYRFRFYKLPLYRYPLTWQLATFTRGGYQKTVFTTLRSLLLLGLIFLMARPQWVDARSRINVDGVNIMITLDVSGSMQLSDSMADLKNGRTRIMVAKQEAIRFVQKRVDDPIGIVIFGADAVSRCPLTLDKKILTQLIHSIELGLIDHRGTSLGTGIATAVRKLKNSKAKSKIIILLTDGKPTKETDFIPVETAIDLAKKFNVKIYTIGIGNKRGAYVMSAFGVSQMIPDSIDETLLQKIAQQTGGRFFRANNQSEMKQVYATINTLEKTTYQTNLFSRYYELFTSFIWIIVLFFAAELFLRLFLWKGLI